MTYSEEAVAAKIPKIWANGSQSSVGALCGYTQLWEMAQTEQLGAAKTERGGATTGSPVLHGRSDEHLQNTELCTTHELKRSK